MLDSNFELLFFKEGEALSFLHGNPQLRSLSFADESTFLHKAATHGSSLLVYYIMSNTQPDFWVKKNDEGKTAAQSASAKGYTEIMAIMQDFFLSYKCDRGIRNLKLFRSLLSPDIQEKYTLDLLNISSIKFRIQEEIRVMLCRKSLFDQVTQFSGNFFNTVRENIVGTISDTRKSADISSDLEKKIQ